VVTGMMLGETATPSAVTWWRDVPDKRNLSTRSEPEPLYTMS